ASEINWMIPVSVARVLQQALDLDEDLRPTTAADFRRMLRQASTGSIEQPGTVLVAGDATNPGASFHNDVTRQASQPINWSESQTVVDPSKSVPPVMSPPESFQTRPVAPPPAHPTLPPTVHISPPEPEHPAPKPSKKWMLPVLALVMLVLVVGVIGARMVWQARKNNMASSSAPTQAEKKNKPSTPSPKKSDETPMVAATPLSPTFTNRIGMEFILISPGSFLMGSPESEADRETDEGPQHKVTISQPFYLGKYEVTQAEWKVVMEDNPSEFPGERLPVDSVSWDDCQEFLKKLNARNDGYTYRLPSEAEWEYACRAGSKTPFSFGEKVTMKQVNFSGNFPYGDDPETDGQGKPVSVGSYPANAWGLYEMHGNVREWCQDWLQVDYTDAPTDGRPWVSGPETQYRVLRGGAWNVNARDCRSATRSGNTPDATDNSYGLRVVAEKVEKN
ncbi:MAG TPA: formylglycine-generating enzyme family protein, partial [Acidobacteriota bacterium]|nr:formylglycine-generating enzyme family protein [Acidobacteriota bacterium]